MWSTYSILKFAFGVDQKVLLCVRGPKGQNQNQTGYVNHDRGKNTPLRLGAKGNRSSPFFSAEVM